MKDPANTGGSFSYAEDNRDYVAGTINLPLNMEMRPKSAQISSPAYQGIEELVNLRTQGVQF